MNLWDKVKLLFTFNKKIKVIIEELDKVKEAKTKSGWKSSEFWATLLASAGAVVLSLNGVLPPIYAALTVSASAMAYTLSRSFVKQTDPDVGKKSGFKSSEFYIGILSDLGAVLAAAGGLIPPAQSAMLLTASRIVYSISRALAKQP